jgi:hypothetical protein
VTTPPSLDIPLLVCWVWHDDPQHAVPAHSQPSSALGESGVLQFW